MIERALAELAAALRDDGVGGQAARRALAEARDHLEEAAAGVGEDEALRCFGSPRRLARLVAAEVATARTRTAALATFAALAVVGVAYAALFLTLPRAGSFDLFDGSVPGLGPAALIGIVFAPQLAAVVLATARSASPRAYPDGPADDLFDDLAPVLALPPLRRLRLSSRPWRFALLVGAAAATAVAIAGIAGRDPYDGLVRAAAELVAVLGCFVVLGRPLGLRR